MQAKVKCKTARIWTYVRDERPWNSQAPFAAWYRFSTDRKGARPLDRLGSVEVWMHAGGYQGFNELHRKVYRTRDDARADVVDSIERFYNPRRRHSTLGYLSPVEFEKRAMLA